MLTEADRDRIERCSGAGSCASPHHFHGCYADLDGSACNEPQEHKKYPDFCMVPPVGWWCSREPGHDGPCAAYQWRDDPRLEDIGQPRGTASLLESGPRHRKEET